MSCANFKVCMGIWGRCKVEKGERCRLFEECVLPLGSEEIRRCYEENICKKVK